MAISPEELKKKYKSQSSPNQTFSIEGLKEKYQVSPDKDATTRNKRIAQGLPVSTEARFERTGKAEPSVGGNILRGVLKPFASIVATATSGFRPEEEGEGAIQARPMPSKYLGDVKPLQTALARSLDKGVAKAQETGKKSDIIGPTAGGVLGTTVAAIGTGLEIGSYALGTQPLKAGVKGLTPGLKELAKQTAKTEGIAGGMGALGASLRETSNQEGTLGEKARTIGGQTTLGVGTGLVGGPVLGALSRGVGTVGRMFTPGGRTQLSEQAVSQTVNNFKELFPTIRGRRFIDNVETRKGDAPFRLIVESGVLKDVDVVNNKPIVSGKSFENMRNNYQEVENILQESLDPAVEPRLLSAQDIVKKSFKYIDNSNYTTATKNKLKKQALDEIRAEVQSGGANQSLRNWNNIKRSFWDEAFGTRAITEADKLSKNRKYIVGRAIREAIEETAENPDIKELNSVLGDYAEAFKILRQFENQTLKKGQLGRYVLQGIGTGVGIQAGGPIGGLVGALGGDTVTNILQKLSVNSPLRSGLIKYIQKYRPDLLEEVSQFITKRQGQVANAPRLGAGAIPMQAPVSPDANILQVSSGQLPLGAGRVARDLPAVIPGQNAQLAKQPIPLGPEGSSPSLRFADEKQAKNIIKRKR